MKKLMMAIVIAAIAIGVNGATIKWSTEYEICNATEDAYTAATMVYLINSATLTQSAIYEAVSGGKTLAAAIGANAVASTTLSDGKITTQTLTVDTTGSTTYYMALFDSGVGDNGAIYFSEQINKSIMAVGSANYAFSSNSSIDSAAANMTGFNASEGGWVAVPEPTSAMLLMLGLCGLALKRKNA